METELARIAERARENPKFRFQTLVHYITPDALPDWNRDENLLEFLNGL